MKVAVINDLHLGLVTSEIDRTEEISGVLKEIAKAVISLKETDKNTVLVINGDVFEDNKPSEKLISVFINFLNYFFGKEIDIFVVVGNHDSINDPENLSCLGFLRKLKKGYSYVKLIDDIKTTKYQIFDNGQLYFTFLPHINKAHLEISKKKYKSTQEYIDRKVDRVMDVVKQGDSHIIFSHLNVKGLVPGSEENLLRKSRVFLPDSIIMDEEPLDGRVKPIIIQGHIHKHQKYKNVYVVGSQTYTDSSDTDVEKYFCVVHVSEELGVGDRIEFIPVKNNRRFYDIELDLMDGKNPMDEAKKYLKDIKPNSIVKFSPTVSDMTSSYDWEAFRNTVATKTGSYVKPVNPKVVVRRVVRNPEQKIGMKPVKALKVWFRSYNHERKDVRYKLAKGYLYEDSVRKN